MKRKTPHRPRFMRSSLVLILCVLAVSLTGCLDSELFKRFRTAYGPGAIQGFSNAVTNPADAETGLRQSLTALFDGLGAVIQPRTGAAGGSSGSSSGGSSGSSSSSN